MSTIKTAISLQQSLFEQAESLAKKLRISRSHLFAMALEEFIQRHQNRALLEEINQAYEDKAPELSQAYILAELKLPGTQLRDTFKKSEAWGRLVVRGCRRSTYRLNR